MQRDYLSASAINLFITCPTSFYLKYVLGLDTDETDLTYANYGTLVHNINENIANGDYFFVEDAIDEYVAGFPSTGMPMDNYFDEGIEGIKKHWEFCESPDIDIIGAEVKFNIKPFDDILPFLGFIDLVYINKNGDLVVRDYKTGKPYDENKIMNQIQPYFYSEACLHLFGQLPKYFEFQFPRFDEVRTVVIDEEFMEFNRLKLKGIWKQIENMTLKANWNPFFCEHFCSCRTSCPLWQNKKGGR